MKILNLALIISCKLALVTSQCSDGEHTILDGNTWRSSNYEKGDFEEWRCDDDLEPGWYRFTGPQGTDLVNEPVEQGNCGTVSPIWMNGDIPSVEEGVVNRDVCIPQYMGSNCASGHTIEVQNCGDFRVYNLRTTGFCEGYCVGTEVACPPGHFSPNFNFSPGCKEDEYPDMETDPYITFSVQIEETDHFFPRRFLQYECNHDYEGDEIFYEVFWWADDTLITAKTGSAAISSTNMPATITDLHDELRWSVASGSGLGGKTLKCDVRALHFRNWLSSPARSASFWIGLEIVSPQPSRTKRDTNYVYELVVDEGGDVAHFEVRPTVPVLCPVGLEDCVLSLEVNIPYVEDGVQAAQCNGQPLEQAVIIGHTACKVDVPMTLDTTQTFTLDVKASTDNAYDGSHRLLLNVRTFDANPNHWIWQNYDLPEVQVFVTDQDPLLSQKVCKARNDPHMTTFDRRVYEMQLEGAFVLYRHKHLPLEVHAYFKRCNNYATCVCGGAVRAGLDLFIFDKCGVSNRQRVTLAECGNHMMKIEDFGGNKFQITLPTGTKVKLWNSYIDIYPSLSDYNSVEGLCGTLDNDCGNDFPLQGGGYSTDPKASSPNCDYRRGMDRWFHPNDFASSWRVELEDSLYTGVLPDDGGELHADIYCGCPDGETPVCDTEADPNVANCIQSRYDRTQRYFGPCVDARRRRRSTGALARDDVTDAPDEMFPFDPDFQPGTPTDFPTGWTNETAYAYCLGYFDSQAVNDCNSYGVVDLKYSVEACVYDVMLCGCEDYSVTHMEDVLTTCRHELMKNTTLQQDPDVQNLVSSICQTTCVEGQGFCDQTGMCSCHNDYQGVDCSELIGHVPQEISIPDGGVCDVTRRPCTQTAVEGDKFHDNGGLLCKVVQELTMANGVRIEMPAEVSAASFQHEQRVLCNLSARDVNAAMVTFYVSVANDHGEFSEAKPLHLFDSQCMVCFDTQCLPKSDYCYIEQQCYNGGDKHPADDCKQCDSGRSLFEFSNACDSMSSMAIALTVVAVVSVVVLGVVASVLVVKKFTKPRSVVTPRVVQIEMASDQEPPVYLEKEPTTDLQISPKLNT